MTTGLLLAYCPYILEIKPAGRADLTTLAFALARFPFVGFFRIVGLKGGERMGTKPMVFPLDGSGRLYALYDENDDQICTGSRETCYRLLALMMRVKKPVNVEEAQTPGEAIAPERAFQAAGGSITK